MIGSLARVRWRCLVNPLLKGSASQRLAARMAVVWSGLFAAAIGWVSYEALAVLFGLAREQRLHLLPYRLPVLVLLWAFWMLVFSGVSVAIQHLYIQRDITLLLTAPVQPALAFAAKLADVSLANAAFFGFTGGPIVAAYALVRGYMTLEYVLRCGLALLAFSVIASMLGTMAALVVMRILPAHRLRELLGALGLALVSLLYIMLNLAVHRLQNPERAAQGLQALRDSLETPALMHGPWLWVGDVIATPSGYPEAYGDLGLTALVAAGVFLIAVSLAERCHWSGWLASQEVAGRVGRSTGARCRPEALLAWLSGPVRAFLLKDLRTMARDMRQLSMLLLPAAVVIVLVLNLRVIPEARTVPAGFLCLSLLPVVGMIGVRIATSAFVGESRAFWAALAAPATKLSILLGKLAYTAALTFPLALFASASFAVLFGMSARQWAVVVGMTLLSDLALCGIGVGLTARYMDITSAETSVNVPGAARLLALGLQLAYSFVIAACVVVAWGLVSLADWPAMGVYFLAAAVIATVSGLATVSPLAAAARRLSGMEL